MEHSICNKQAMQGLQGHALVSILFDSLILPWHPILGAHIERTKIHGGIPVSVAVLKMPMAQLFAEC